MLFPRNSGVVIIDDKFVEALPLIDLLGKHGVSNMYYNGELTELKGVKFSGIRIIMLDFVLGNDGQSLENKINKLTVIVKTIAHDDNGPFLIIAWTKHKEYIEDLKESFDKNNIFPIEVIGLDKLKYFEKDEEGEYRLKSTESGEKDVLVQISEDIKEQLTASKVDSFLIFNKWENMVNQAVSRTVNEICGDLYQYDKNWNDNMLKVFSNMAKASAGKHIDFNKPDTEDIIKNGYKTINTTLIDTIENELMKTDLSSINVVFDSDIKIENNVLAKVNKKLLISTDSLENIEPGSIVEFNIDETIKRIINDSIDFDKLSEIFSKTDEYRKYKEEGKNIEKEEKNFQKYIKKEIKEKAIGIKVEITPRCDYAQKKGVNNKYIAGIFLPVGYKGMLNNARYNYKSPIIEFKEVEYIVLLDYRFLIISDFPKDIQDSEKSICKLRRNILIDIQNEFSNYVSRVGVTNL